MNLDRQLSLHSAPSPSPQNILSVSEVNIQAKQLLERKFAAVFVAGEISNFKNVSGHCYLTLKDAASQLSAVCFKRQAGALKFRLENGLEVVARGKLTVYPPYGRYQLVIDSIEPKGAGGLQLAFEQLKEKLAKEGLFATERKRALPTVPNRVMVITSPTGAVIRDIIHVATRRFSGAQILLVPAKVQGDSAANELIRALDMANAYAKKNDGDLIILARGGGSLEDLWCFNEERLARAIAASPLPVVSAVGHETDYTIADFVADCRAPTPSAAAEIAFPESKTLLERLQQHRSRLHGSLDRQIKDYRMRLEHGRLKLSQQTNRINEEHQRLAYSLMRFEQDMRGLLRRKQKQLTILNQRLIKLHPKVRLRESYLKMQHQAERQEKAVSNRFGQARRMLEHAVQKLDALSPLNVLGRGYSIVQNLSGDVVRTTKDVVNDEEIQIRLGSGKVRAKVRQVMDD